MKTPAHRPLRILFVFRAPVGGLFRNVYDVVKGLVARGHHVGIFCDSTTGGTRGEALLEELKPLLSLGLYRLPMHRNPHISDYFALRETARLIRDLKLDVVHGEGAKGGLYARFGGIFSGNSGPVRAYTPHGGSLNYHPGSLGHRFFMRVEQLLEKGTDLFLFESAFVRNRFVDFVCETKKPSIIALNGLYPHEYEAHQPAEDATDFFYMGEFRNAKGLDTLIDAMALLAGQDRRPSFTLIGAGPDEAHMREMIEARGLGGQIRWRGVTPAASAFTMGRIMVLPSRFESLPYVILEAVAGQVPLISTNVGGIGEILPPETLIPPNDPTRLALAMAEVLDRPYAGVKAEAAVRSQAIRLRFTVQHMLDTIEAGYYRALTERRPGSL